MIKLYTLNPRCRNGMHQSAGEPYMPQVIKGASKRWARCKLCGRSYR